MTLRRRILDYALAGLLLLLPVVVLRSSLRDPARLSGFDHAILRISGPLQSAASWLIEGIGGVWNRYVDLVGVEDENRELRGENDRLHRELATARRKAADVDALEALARLGRETPAETVGARVVGGSLNPYFRVLRLRLDRSDIDEDSPVVDGKDALVGRARHVFGPYADVVLLSDPASKVEVVVERTHSRGTLIGLGADDSYRCKLGSLVGGPPVAVGDQVFTAGLGEFPPGLLVGKIATVASDPGGLFQDVVVEPAVDFSSLSRVLVLVAPPPPPDPDPAGHPSRPATSARPL